VRIPDLVRDRVEQASEADRGPNQTEALPAYTKGDRDPQSPARLPGYTFDEERGVVVFQSRGTVVSVSGKDRPEIGSLKPDTYERARLAAPGWDIRALEQEWRAWAGEVPKNADGAFIGFCKKRFAERGRP